MTSGGGMKIFRVSSENFYKTPERGALKKLGDSENLYTLKPKGEGGGGARKKLNR